MQIGQVLRKRQHHRADADSMCVDELCCHIGSTADHVHSTTRSRQHIAGEGVNLAAANGEVMKPVCRGHLILLRDNRRKPVLSFGSGVTPDQEREDRSFD